MRKLLNSPNPEALAMLEIYGRPSASRSDYMATRKIPQGALLLNRVGEEEEGKRMNIDASIENRETRFKFFNCSAYAERICFFLRSAVYMRKAIRLVMAFAVYYYFFFSLSLFYPIFSSRFFLSFAIDMPQNKKSMNFCCRVSCRRKKMTLKIFYSST